MAASPHTVSTPKGSTFTNFAFVLKIQKDALVSRIPHKVCEPVNQFPRALRQRCKWLNEQILYFIVNQFGEEKERTVSIAASKIFFHVKSQNGHTETLHPPSMLTHCPNPVVCAQDYEELFPYLEHILQNPDGQPLKPATEQPPEAPRPPRLPQLGHGPADGPMAETRRKVNRRRTVLFAFAALTLSLLVGVLTLLFSRRRRAA